MDENRGQFIPHAQISVGPGNAAGMPTLAIGEVVEIKGVRFRVSRIKLYSGKLGLEMLRKGQP